MPWLPAASAIRSGGTLDFTLSASPSPDLGRFSGLGQPCLLRGERLPAIGFISRAAPLQLAVGHSGARSRSASDQSVERPAGSSGTSRPAGGLTYALIRHLQRPVAHGRPPGREPSLLTLTGSAPGSYLLAHAVADDDRAVSFPQSCST